MTLHRSRPAAWVMEKAAQINFMCSQHQLASSLPPPTTHSRTSTPHPSARATLWWSKSHVIYASGPLHQLILRLQCCFPISYMADSFIDLSSNSTFSEKLSLIIVAQVATTPLPVTLQSNPALTKNNFAVLRMSCAHVVQDNGHKYMAAEHWKCGWCYWVTEF
jgi:hypothetical protein